MNKIDILKAYLGKFLRKPSNFIRDNIRKLKVKDSNLVITNTGDMTVFNEIITQLLLQEGRKRYKVVSSHQVLDVYLRNDEEMTSLRDFDSEVLIVIVLLRETPNKIRWDILYQLAMERNLSNMGITVITQYINQNDLNNFKNLNFTILNLQKQTNNRRDIF